MVAVPHKTVGLGGMSDCRGVGSNRAVSHTSIKLWHKSYK